MSAAREEALSYVSTEDVPFVLGEFDTPACVEALEDELDMRQEYEIFLTRTYPDAELKRLREEQYNAVLQGDETPEDVLPTDTFEYHLFSTLSFYENVVKADAGPVLEQEDGSAPNYSEYVADHILQEASPERTTIIVEGGVRGVDVVLSYRDVPWEQIY